MRLLIFVRKIDPNDSRMGFFSGWLDEFSKKVASIVVITWQESNKEDLPVNVTLCELSGKKVKKFFLLQKKLFQLLPRTDALYVHMNPEYSLASFPLCVLFRVPITQWYAHGAVSIRRKLMERVVKNIVTSSEKGFREPLYKNKVFVVGQGIDTTLFSFKPKLAGTPLRLLQVSRISLVKDVETVLYAVKQLQSRGVSSVAFSIYGEPALPNDYVYFENLKKIVMNLGLQSHVHFYGGVTHALLPDIYHTHDILINMSTTGSLDKTVLEALSSGMSVITANDAFQEILPENSRTSPHDPEMLTNRLQKYFLLSDGERNKGRVRLRNFVDRNHSLKRLVDSTLSILQT